MDCCGVCGYKAKCGRRRYGELLEIRHIYRVGFEYLCQNCAEKADSFVNYCGNKKPEDKQALWQFLISSVSPMRDYYALMNAGYC